MAGPAHFDCPKCGHRYYEPQRFCVECGLDFRAAFRRCPKCKMDTPRDSEKCIECGYDLEAHDMRRPKYIVLAIIVGVAFLALAVPYWWMHTPLGKRHGMIITGDLFISVPGESEYVPMFYEYQSGTRSLRKARSGEGWNTRTIGIDATKLLPVPEPVIPYVNVTIGERVYVLRKQRDADGELWYNVRRYRKDVVREGWVHESNIEFKRT